MKFDVISFGSAVLDFFVTSPDIKVIKAEEFFTGKAIAVPYGTKSEIERLVISSGGGGTNTAAGFSRLGLKAAIVARCGWDFAGKIIRREIKKEKIDDRFLVQIEGEQTDQSVILVAPDGGRTILVYRGGTKLERSLINWREINAFWFYISSLEGNLDLLEELVNFARKNEIKIAVNPGKKELEQRERFLKIARGFDVLILNREEAAELMEMTIIDERIFEKICLVFPKEMVVITDGANGVSVCIPGKGRLVMDGFKVRMTDATGAGDGFSAGFIGGLVKSWKLEKALKLGVCNGASVVTKIGAKTGLIREEEINFWLSRKISYYWKK